MELKHFQLTKTVPVIFHNLRGYESHIIFCEINKSVVKIDVIPNRLEKYMKFSLNKNFFIDNMKFMNPSYKKLVKNLSDNDFKYLTEKFESKSLELLRKMLILMSMWTVLTDVMKKNCLTKNAFTAP